MHGTVSTKVEVGIGPCLLRLSRHGTVSNKVEVGMGPCLQRLK